MKETVDLMLSLRQKSNMYVMCTVLRRNISIVLYVAQQHDTV